MNDIHRRAKALSVELGIPIAAAYRELGRRGAAERKRREDARRIEARASLERAEARMPYVD